MAPGYGVVGTGPVVILVHSSVSGRRQWRSLTAVLEDRFRVVALDLIGYGETPAWAEGRTQQLSDQSTLVHEVADEVGAPLALAGHSLGGSVAPCAAAELGDRLPGLVLLEPNPFSLLDGAAPDEYREAAGLRDAVMDAPARQHVSAVAAATHVVSANDTVQPIAGIVTILEEMRPDRKFSRLDGGGHMAPLTRPDLVNPIVASTLDDLAHRS